MVTPVRVSQPYAHVTETISDPDPRKFGLGDESADKVTVRLKFRPDEPWEVEPDEVHSLRAQGILIEDDELESDASAPRRKRTPPVTDADTDPDAHPETEPDNGGGEESPSAE